MEKKNKKLLLGWLLGIVAFLVFVFFLKPLMWFLISAGCALLSFILAKLGRGWDQWWLVPLLILSLGLAPRLWGEVFSPSPILWIGGIAGMAIVGAFIVGLFISSLPPKLEGLPAFLAGLCVLLIWGEFPQIWPLYFLGAIVFGAIGIALIFIALGRELRQGGVAPLLLVPMALIAKTLVVWTLGSFLWILVSGGIALLGFIAGLLWESRAEIRKQIQALYEEVIEGWKDFFSIARDEQ